VGNYAHFGSGFAGFGLAKAAITLQFDRGVPTSGVVVGTAAQTLDKIAFAWPG